MRFSVQTAVLSLGLCVVWCGACGSKGSPRLEGHWRGVGADGVASDAQSAAAQFASATELDFKGDMVVVGTPKGKQSGKYKVKSEDKTSITIWTEGDTSADPQTFVFDSPNAMKWNVLEGKTISFQREGAAH